MNTPDTPGASMTTRVVILLAALFAIACVLAVGRNNSSGLLVTPFVLWVFAPFALLGLLVKASGSWDSRRHKRLHALVLGVCVVTTCVYGAVAFIATPSRPAFWFLVLPMVSLVLMAIIYVLALRKQGAACR